MPGTARENGLEALRTGNPRSAIHLLREALESNAHDPDVLGYLGVAHGLLNEPDEAILYLEKARNLAPHSAPLHANLGRALALAGRAEEAIAAYRCALEVDPTYERAHLALSALITPQSGANGGAPPERNGVGSREDEAEEDSGALLDAPWEDERHDGLRRSRLLPLAVTVVVGALVLLGSLAFSRADHGRARQVAFLGPPAPTTSQPQQRPAEPIQEFTAISLPPERPPVAEQEARIRAGIVQAEEHVRDCLRVQAKYEREAQSPSAKPEDEWLRTEMLKQIQKSVEEARNRRNRMCYELADLCAGQGRRTEAADLLQAVQRAQPVPKLAEEIQAKLKELQTEP